MRRFVALHSYKGSAVRHRGTYASASWTLVDQCIVSGGNFLLNVLLARALSEEVYGTFALFLGSIFVLRAVDYSLVSYPLSIRLSSVEEVFRPRLLGNTALLAVALSLPLAVVIGGGSIILHRGELFFSATLCFICWQAQETCRRFILADLRYQDAIFGDFVSYVGQVVIISIMLTRVGPFTLSIALYSMSGTFALGATVHAMRIRFALPVLKQLAPLALDYFSVGKWSLINYELVLARVQLFPWILAATVGTAASASLLAGMNIANIMNPVIFGIGNAIPQVAAQAYRGKGLSGACRAVYPYFVFGFIPIVAICITVMVLPGVLLQAAYGYSSSYNAMATGLQLLALAGLIDYVAEMTSKTMLGIEAGRLASMVNLISVVIAVFSGLAMI